MTLTIHCIHMIHDTDNLHFSSDMPHRFSKVAARQSAGARTAIRRLPVRIIRGSVQCRGRPRMNAEAYVLD